jgi:hypothetical protein
MIKEPRARRYRATVKGKETNRRSSAKYKKTSKGIESQRKSRTKYYQTARGRYVILLRNARSRNLQVEISQEYFEKLIKENKCHYCFQALPAAGSSVDRVDNKLGYTENNVVPCCKRCNNLKGRIEWCGFRYPRTVELLKEAIL